MDPTLVPLISWSLRTCGAMTGGTAAAVKQPWPVSLGPRLISVHPLRWLSFVFVGTGHVACWGKVKVLKQFTQGRENLGWAIVAKT